MQKFWPWANARWRVIGRFHRNSSGSSNSRSSRLADISRGKMRWPTPSSWPAMTMGFLTVRLNHCAGAQ